MRIVFRWMMVLTIIIALILTGVFIYFKINASDILRAEMTRYTDRSVDFDHVFIVFPSSIRFQNLFIEDLGTAQEVFASLSVPHLFLRKIYFSSVKIINPDFRIAQDIKSPLDFTFSPQTFRRENQKDVPVKGSSREKRFKTFFINRLTIQNGHFHFLEIQTEQEEKIIFSLQQLQLTIEKVDIPISKPRKTYFDATALISGFNNRFQDDQVKLLGWADFFQKNMEAKLVVEAMQGQAGLSADFVSDNNDLLVQGVMGLAFSQEMAPKKPESFEGFLIDALKATKTQLSLHFRFQTKMDHFQIGEISLSGSLDKK